MVGREAMGMARLMVAVAAAVEVVVQVIALLLLIPERSPPRILLVFLPKASVVMALGAGVLQV